MVLKQMNRVRNCLVQCRPDTDQTREQLRVIQFQPSTFSLIAACFYAAVAASCLLALASAIRRRQARWHVSGWSAIALLFVALALMRVFAVEDLLREELRSMLRGQGAYDDRHEFQGPIIAALCVTAAFLGGFWAYRTSRTISGRRNIAAVIAVACGGVLIFLNLLRIVSLHSVDQLLYGPLKLNWVIDLGASAVVLACAVYYWRVVTAKA